MIEEQVLNRVEHHLLSMQVDDTEPLFILYSDTKRDIEGTTLNQILHALIKLTHKGFSVCIIKKGEKWQQCKKLTLTDLKRRFKGQSEEEKTEYPMYVNEYYFKITEKGKLEESKEIYNTYYPQV